VRNERRAGAANNRNARDTARARHERAERARYQREPAPRSRTERDRAARERYFRQIEAKERYERAKRRYYEQHRRPAQFTDAFRDTRR
jgi:hypothetical protein